MPLWSKITLGLLAATLVAGFLLWWLMDHRRGTAWAISVVRDRFPDVPQISATDLQRWINDVSRQPPIVLDARSTEENAVSHLPEALHLDVESVTDETLKRLDPSRSYVTYCSAGYRACQLARRLHSLGIADVANLEGGIFTWANEGHPVVQGERPVTAVHPYHSLFSRMLKPERRQP